jgi:hypothetical protein
MASNIVTTPESAPPADEPHVSEAQKNRLQWLSNGPVPAAMTPAAPDDLSNAEGAQ